MQPKQFLRVFFFSFWCLAFLQGCLKSSTVAPSRKVTSQGSGGGASVQTNSPENPNPPPPPPADSQVLSITAGGSHTCASTAQTTYCWGMNDYGQLGRTWFRNKSVVLPSIVDNIPGGVTGLSSGFQHTCGILNGSALCWGRWDMGQTGADLYLLPAPNSWVFYPYLLPSFVDFTKISATPVTVTKRRMVAQVATGSEFSCALVDGFVQCFGTLEHVISPGSRSGLPQISSGVTAVTAGTNHVCVIQDGKVLCWGLAYDGRVGNLPYPGTSYVQYPTLVAGLPTGVTAITAGATHSCAIANGRVYCWGDNAFGQLGDGTNTKSLAPVLVSGLPAGVTSISSKNLHTCAIVNGGAKCWGNNLNGQLGNNSVTQSNVPVDVVGLSSGVSSISTGFSHTCAIANGKAMCWGAEGALGIESASQILVPTLVKLP